MPEVPSTYIKDKDLAEEMAYGERDRRQLADIADTLDLEEDSDEHDRDAVREGEEAGRAYIDSLPDGAHRDALRENLEASLAPEPEEVYKADESHEQIQDLHELVRDFAFLSEADFSLRYGSTKAEFERAFTEYRKGVEKHSLWDEAQELNGVVEQVDEEAGLYSITLPTGEKMFGSIYSILDSHPELHVMREYANLIRSGEKGTESAVIAARTSGSTVYKSVIVASGSFAQPEVNPHPADYDFAEHLDIVAEDMEEASRVLASLARETIARTNDVSNGVEFSMLKLGTYPDDAVPELRGRSIKWTAEEVKAGRKVYLDEHGEQRTIDITTAAIEPGMIKFDWLVLTDDGQIKEMTKVTNLRVMQESGRKLFDGRQKGAAFQELYFDDISGVGLTEELRDPESILGFLEFLKKDVHKYGGRGVERPNSLKAAKRAYNLLRITGDFEGARDIADELFNSEAAELAARAETISFLPAYIDAMNARAGTIDVAKINSAIDTVAHIIATSELFGAEATDVVSDIKRLQRAFSEGEREVVEKLASHIFDSCIAAVDRYAREVLMQNTYFNELLSE